MSEISNKIIGRTLEVYTFLVYETENPRTTSRTRKTETLWLLLQLLEYIRCDSEDNPLEDFFEN